MNCFSESNRKNSSRSGSSQQNIDLFRTNVAQPKMLTSQRSLRRTETTTCRIFRNDLALKV